MNFYELVKTDGTTEMINPKCIISMKDNGESIALRLCDGRLEECVKESVIGMCMAEEIGLMALPKKESKA